MIVIMTQSSCLYLDSSYTTNEMDACTFCVYIAILTSTFIKVKFCSTLHDILSFCFPLNMYNVDLVRFARFCFFHWLCLGAEYFLLLSRHFRQLPLHFHCVFGCGHFQPYISIFEMLIYQSFF